MALGDFTMARIIPAKIKTQEGGETMICEALEKWLDDNYVVFQPKQNRPYFIIAHPHSDIVFLLIDGDKTYKYDPETEEITDENDEELNIYPKLEKEILSIAEKGMPVEQGVSGLYALYEVDKPFATDEFITDGVLFKDDILNGNLLAEVTKPERENKSGDPLLDVSALIEILQPGAEGYSDNHITKQQQKWRNSYEYKYAITDAPPIKNTIVGNNYSMVEAGFEETGPLQSVTSSETQSRTPSAPEFNQQDIPNETMQTGAETSLQEALSDNKINVSESNNEIQPATVTSLDNDPNVRKRLFIFTEMARLCIESIVQGKSIYIAGLALSSHDIVHPQMMLPVLLVAASDRWAPVVKKGNKGGFRLKMKSNQNALFGMEVVDIDPSAPFTFFMPVTNVVRTMYNGKLFSADRSYEIYERWLKRNNIHLDLEDDIEIRLLTADL